MGCVERLYAIIIRRWFYGVIQVAVSYTQTLSMDMVVSEIEALLDWRNHILRQKFFPDAGTKPADPQAPSALLMWCRKEAERGTVERKLADRLGLVHEEMCKVAGQVIDAQGALSLELYDGFENQFEAFVTQVRRLQQDLSDTAGAVDTITGLRTVSGMRADLKREQDRFDRKGTSFSIANVEIDHLNDIQSKYDRRAQDAIYASIAAVIARTVRSFDDAYYLGKGEFIIVLKHVEFMDACAVMDRMRGDIETAPVFLPSGEKVRITTSFGIAEGLQRESVEVAIEHAKSALNEAKGLGGNRVSEFRETSALVQYAKDMNKK